MKPLKPGRLALTFAGCFLGAGYVSGQELWQFFGQFGLWGLAGLLLAMGLLCAFGVLLLRLAVLSGCVEFGDGEKEIRVVLPWSVRCYFKEINLEGATYITPVKKEKTILFYGDSITHGYDSAHPLNTYAKRVADGLCAEGFVKAVGGECFLPELARVKHSKNPDYIVIAYGTNDWSKNNKEAFDKDSKEFINTISANYPQAKIFVLTPIWRKDSVKETDSFGDIFYVGKHLADICDGLKNVHLIDGWNLVSHNENLYGDLRLHPNDNGFGEYAKSLLAEIKEYI